MCGITGIARLRGAFVAAEVTEDLRAMTGAQTSRGPDETTMLVDDPVGLGFGRLSIMDIEGGGQPFVSTDESTVLIVNGEIYNHRELAAELPAGTLRSRSDCEVLLHLYRRDGLAFLDRVRGMFALALWDRTRRTLLLARDCFGIKPLFLQRDANRVIFGSEIKALLQERDCPRAIDWSQALGSRSTSWEPVFDSAAPVTWFRGVEAVRPGTIVRIDLTEGTLDEHVYWQLPDFSGDTDPGLSDGEFVRRYGELLESSVTDCLMSDVEVGLMLSGGVDSASIAALAGRRLHTFTVLNATTALNGDAEHADLVARHLGLPNHQVLFEHDRAPAADEWRHLLWHQESPVCEAEQFFKYQLYRHVRLARPGLRVMLLGQGSDEFNGGYSVDLSEGEGWPGFHANLESMRRRAAHDHRPRAAWWDLPGLPLLRADALPTACGPDAYAAFVAMKYRDIEQYNCWHEDRSAAANSIEARVPFLDRRLVELTAAVPVRRRRQLLWDKRILRDAVEGLLPPEVVARPKVPFVLGPGGEYTNRMLADMLIRSDLVEQALAGTAADVLDADGLLAAVATLRADPEALPVTRILRLVNLGLLDSMAAARSVPMAPGVTPRGYAVHDWAGQRTEVERLTLNRRPVDDDTVIQLTDGALLLRDETAPNVCYLGVDGGIEYAMDTDDADVAVWLRFLRALDGDRTVGEALTLACATRADVDQFLTESLAAGIVEVLPAAEPADELRAA